MNVDIDEGSKDQEMSDLISVPPNREKSVEGSDDGDDDDDEID